MKRSVKIFLSFPLLGLLVLITGAAYAEDFRSVINDCWKDKSHVEMSACVVSLAQKSSKDLGSLEQELTTKIQNEGEEPRYIQSMKDTFVIGERSFKVYRTHQCNFVASLAKGGNSAHDLGTACMYQLNSERIKQLKDIEEGWLITESKESK